MKRRARRRSRCSGRASSPRRRRCRGPAALSDSLLMRRPFPARKPVTSMTRSATASRTSASWKMPSSATPSRFLSRDQVDHDLAVGRRRARRSARRAAGSDAAVMKPRAMLTRCCSPPEKVAGGRLHSRSGRLRRASSVACPLARLLALSAPRVDQRLGDDVEGRDARHGAQELADIAERVAPDRQHRARAGAGEVDQLVAVADEDLAGVGGDSCRRASSGSSSCRRRTGRRARRTRRP